MATSTSVKKSIPSKTVPSKTVPSKSISNKSVPGKSIPQKTVPSITNGSTSNNKNSPKKMMNGNNHSLSTRGLLPSDSESLDSYMTLPPCSHLSKVLSSASRDAVLKTYAAGVRIVIVGFQTKNKYNDKTTAPLSGYFTRKGEKVSINLLQKARSRILRCRDCQDSFIKGENNDIHNNIYMCLQCTNIGCWAKGHAYSHAKNSGHVFGKF